MEMSIRRDWPRIERTNAMLTSSVDLRHPPMAGGKRPPAAEPLEDRAPIVQPAIVSGRLVMIAFPPQAPAEADLEANPG
jgi:hypothetical protein